MEILPARLTLDKIAQRWGMSEKKVLEALCGETGTWFAQDPFVARVRDVSIEIGFDLVFKKVINIPVSRYLLEEIVDFGSTYLLTRTVNGTLYGERHSVVYKKENPDGTFDPKGVPIRISDLLVDREILLNFEKSHDPNESVADQGKPDLKNPEGSQYLVGQKEISNYYGKEWQTAKKHLEKAGILRHNKQGKPITTTFEISEYRLKTAT